MSSRALKVLMAIFLIAALMLISIVAYLFSNPSANLCDIRRGYEIKDCECLGYKRKVMLGYGSEKSLNSQCIGFVLSRETIQEIE